MDATPILGEISWYRTVDSRGSVIVGATTGARNTKEGFQFNYAEMGKATMIDLLADVNPNNERGRLPTKRGEAGR